MWNSSFVQISLILFPIFLFGARGRKLARWKLHASRVKMVKKLEVFFIGMHLWKEILANQIGMYFWPTMHI